MATVRTWDGINGIADGRPVKFSQATWTWYFTDTNGDDPAERLGTIMSSRETDRMDQAGAAGPGAEDGGLHAGDSSRRPHHHRRGLPMATRIRAMQLLEDVIGDRATVTEEDVHSYCYDTQG